MRIIGEFLLFALVLLAVLILLDLATGGFEPEKKCTPPAAAQIVTL